MTRVLLLLVPALALAGCATLRQRPPPGEPVQLEDLIRQIKSDVGQYNDYAAAHAADAPLNTACGGKVDLRITRVAVSVTTVSKSSQGGSVGAEVSPMPFVKLGGGAAAGSARESSQVLSFTLEPMPGAAPGVRPAGPPSQLYAVLTDLRQSLLKASDATPCLRFPKDGQDNSVEFAFQATRSSSTSFGVNLMIFAIGGNTSRERTAAHTIKINFEGGGGSSFFEVQ